MERRWPGSGAFAIFVILVAAWPAPAQTVNVSRCGAGVHEAEGLGAVLFPEDQISVPRCRSEGTEVVRQLSARKVPDSGRPFR